MDNRVCFLCPALRSCLPAVILSLDTDMSGNDKAVARSPANINRMTQKLNLSFDGIGIKKSFAYLMQEVHSNEDGIFDGYAAALSQKEKSASEIWAYTECSHLIDA